MVYAYRRRTTKNPPMELMISVLLHRIDDGEWTEAELSPIRTIRIMEISPTYSPLAAVVTLAGGEEYEVDFVDIDGYRSC